MAETIIQKVENFIAKNALFNKQKTILAAVSGGIDSVVLLDMLLKLGYKCEVAHCNFQLRGIDADNDARFVKELAKKHNIKLHYIEFYTKKIASESGKSIEMTARKLRYEWFENLLQQYHYQCIAVAHHKNDNAETILLNLARSTGIRGLAGIKPKNGNIIRPLLCLTRYDIECYAIEQKLDWCIDLTNKDINYKRNRIRYNIIPQFEKLNPSFIDAISNFSYYLKDTENIYNFAVNHWKEKILSNNTIDIPVLLTSPAPQTILYEILKEFNFSTSDINIIFYCLNRQSGRQFLSNTHRLVKDRDTLIITNLQKPKKIKHFIEEGTKGIIFPVNLTFEIIDAKDIKTLICPPNVALFNLQKIKFPLVIRRWEYGDIFQPFGMEKGMQYLSDYFINRKFNVIEKINVQLLESDGQILWIINHRADMRFRVMPNTKQVLRVTYKE